MKINSKISQFFVLSLLLASFANCQKAGASEIILTNHQQSVLKINVVIPPEETPYCQECLGSPLRGGEKRKIIVSVDGLKGAEFFSIVDATNGFIGESECKNLSVFKNYKVSFYETTAGTRCTYKEI